MKESALLRKRRQAIRAAGGEHGHHRDERGKPQEGDLSDPRASGIAISGGGIRSAIFALGVFQALAKTKHLRRFDYLSTVSGGGYFGGFFASLFVRKEMDFVKVQAALEEGSEPINYLRRNGRYLAPAGPQDLLLGGAVLFRNWVAVFLVLSCFACLCGVFLEMPSLAARVLPTRFPDLGDDVYDRLAGLQSTLRALGMGTPVRRVELLIEGFARLQEGFPWTRIHGSAAHAHLWLSEWLLWGALVVLFVAAPLGWSYFLVGGTQAPRKDQERFWRNGLLALGAVKPFILGINALLVGASLWLLGDAPSLSFVLLYVSVLTSAQTIAADHWLTIRGKNSADTIPLFAGGSLLSFFAGLATCSAALLLALLMERPSHAAWAFFLVLAAFRLLLFCATGNDDEVDRDHFPRYVVSLWLKRWLVVAFVLLLLGAVQTAGRSLYWATLGDLDWLVGLLGTVVTVFAARARTWTMSLSTRTEGGDTLAPYWKRALPTLVAALLAFALTSTTSALAAHWIYDGTLAVSGQSCAIVIRPDLSWEKGCTAFFVLLSLSLGFGFSRRFLNNSTHLPLYSSRITRAFLGASNVRRVPPHLGAKTPRNGSHESSQSPTLVPWIERLVTFPVRSSRCMTRAVQRGVWGSKIFSLRLFASMVKPFAAKWSEAILKGASGLDERPLGPSKAEFNAEKASATYLIPEDDLPLEAYFEWEGPNSPYERGAPLHLINVTVNETVDGRSQEFNPDAKGLGLCIGPCGFSAGVRHHAVFNWKERSKVEAYPKEADFRVFEPKWTFRAKEPRYVIDYERLSLGRWLGISGAAFTTGLGSRTSIGKSFLTGITNVRLGHWWRPGVARPLSVSRVLGPLFWVQQYLLRELCARFPGTANTLWYLSDGGHFENMGAYELLRRRVKTIVLLDAEADPKYEFEGLGHLVRKARIDFHTEIEFIGRDDEAFTSRIAPEVAQEFGTLEDLRPSNQELSKVHAAVAIVRYPEGDDGVLIYVKPTLTGRESADVVRYHAENPRFPQETTIDQFFGEAQWESYRKLGQDIGQRVFATWPHRGTSAARGEPSREE